MNATITFAEMTNNELRQFIEKKGLPKPKSAVRTKEQLINHINTNWNPFKDLPKPTGDGGNPFANGAFDADYCKCWKCFEKGVVVHTHPELHTAEFQNVVDDEILTEFLPVCEKCYDDWEDVCEKCDSRVCTLRYWEDCRGDPCNYCEDCYAEDEDRIEQKCENGNCDRQCIEDEDYCYSCKEDLEEEEEEDDSDDEEGDGMMECLECKGRFPTTIISKWGSICAPCFHIHRKAEEECKAMGAEDFDVPEPKDTEIRGFCIQCDQEGKFIGKEGDEWTCPSCEDEEDDAPAPAPAPAPVRSTWDERVSGDFQNKTICEMFGDECTWNTLANIGADPDSESELSVHIYNYNEGKHFQVRARVNDVSILDRHYSAPGNGERFPDKLMEDLVFYFPGYFLC